MSHDRRGQETQRVKYEKVSQESTTNYNERKEYKEEKTWRVSHMQSSHAVRGEPSGLRLQALEQPRVRVSA